MVTEQQVRLLMSINKGVPLSTAAAKAGMSEPTARKYRRIGKVPGAPKPARTWRTRKDPYADVWEEAEQLLQIDSGLQAKTVFEELERRYPGRFSPGQLRTLQRRFRRWRSQHGPEKEVYFQQHHYPGERCQSDFTDMNSLYVTIGGEPFPHLLYHFVLTYSNWEWVNLAYSETFEALVEGLQGSLWELGAVPLMHRTDNLSAATHKLKESRGRDFNDRYLAVLNHYRLEPSRNNPGRANENGDVESQKYHFKNALDQRLRLRGSRDFTDVSGYMSFVIAIVRDRNSRHKALLEEELAVMQTLPARPLPACRESFVTVTKWSTVRVAKKPYSVPSRLIGERLKVRLFAATVELYYHDELIGPFQRLRGDEPFRIDYRHLVHSLLRKPGAFARSVYQEALYPSLTFRRAYDALVEQQTGRADLEYIRVLHLAATTVEAEVEVALSNLLNAGQTPTFDAVRAQVSPRDNDCPQVDLDKPDLNQYDDLLEQKEAAA
ncbi:MAG TPA: IS21 family transposase [Gammaproteobacteria bacterium]|nr:IS21 family transposase [Gammaproteobacteria bacterium]HIL95703.1 IS21 family transposase [Pseudomonadales bacterium]